MSGRPAAAPRQLAFVGTEKAFTPSADHGVHWLDDAEFPLFAEARASVGAPVTRAEWDEWRGEGYRFCGLVEGDRLVACAAAWSYSEEAWELAAVWTLQPFRGRGHGTAVSSFVTSGILEGGRIATCHTAEDNAAMLRIVATLGYRPTT